MDFELDPVASKKGDQKVESVTSFTRRIKLLLESQVGAGWVRGEVSNLRRQASGHVYFSLKDAGAQLSCVLFRGDAMRQSTDLRDGQQIVAFGEVSVYAARGQYQMIVRTVVEDGVGRLQREFEALKKKLSDEGLFARERKRPLPELPLVVGIVTSPTGAAVQDFVRIMVRRGWRGRLIVLPAKVQGEGAAKEIAAQLDYAGRLGIFDVLVVGRGGGSLEDLWAFNEEAVVRAVVACPVPVISAVGHEIDFTLADFAADLRAETPSGAAELLSSRFGELRDRLDEATDQLQRYLRDGLDSAADQVRGVKARLRLLTPRGQIEQGWLRRDDLANRLAGALAGEMRAKRVVLATTQAALQTNSPQRRVEFESHRLLALWKRLQSASPASVLQRGFAIVRDGENRPIMRRTGVAAGTALEIEFADGRAKVRTEPDHA